VPKLDKIEYLYFCEKLSLRFVEVDGEPYVTAMDGIHERIFTDADFTGTEECTAAHSNMLESTRLPSYYLFH
jgi:hypothetical protein